jgi:hypothetical protein
MTRAALFLAAFVATCWLGAQGARPAIDAYAAIFAPISAALSGDKP